MPSYNHTELHSREAWRVCCGYEVTLNEQAQRLQPKGPKPPALSRLALRVAMLEAWMIRCSRSAGSLVRIVVSGFGWLAILKWLPIAESGILQMMAKVTFNGTIHRKRTREKTAKFLCQRSRFSVRY